MKKMGNLDGIPTSKLGETSFNQIFWDEIKDAITGKARIIKYVNHSIVANIKMDITEEKGKAHKALKMDARDLEIKSIEEGCFENGKKHGYCRIISAKDGSCEVGFFVNDEPKGKYAMYNLDGTYAKEEGLYEGAQNCKTKIKIANYMQKILR